MPGRLYQEEEKFKLACTLDWWLMESSNALAALKFHTCCIYFTSILKGQFTQIATNSKIPLVVSSHADSFIGTISLPESRSTENC